MDADREVYPYTSYNEYIATQRAKSRRSKRQTKRYGWYRTRIAQQLRELCPSATTMLCIGARNDLEVLDFASKGYETQGIDLFTTKHITKCDMSRIDQHPVLCRQTFDAFVAIHAIEHCLDFAGFLRSMSLCRQALACVTPQRASPNAWDCSAFRFAHPEAGTSDIEAAFPGFKLGWRDVVKKTLMFVIVRAT
jgi:hypothetical protein